MKYQTKCSIEAFVAGILLALALIFATGDAWATKTVPPKTALEQEQRQGQDQGQAQTQAQEQDQTQTQDQAQMQDQTLHNANEIKVETAAAGGAAHNEGNQQDVNISSNYEAGPGDLVLVPNNNTEQCLRVVGLAFGNDDASGMLGVPFRSKQCDFGKFAAAADAQGNIELGWYWRCHMKSAYRVFKSRGKSAETAIEDCHHRMLDELGRKRVLDHLQRRVKELTTERGLLLEQVQADSDNYSRAIKKARQDCSEALERQHQSCQEK